jgi:hypothetical protein
MSREDVPLASGIHWASDAAPAVASGPVSAMGLLGPLQAFPVEMKKTNRRVKIMADVAFRCCMALPHTGFAG